MKRRKMDAVVDGILVALMFGLTLATLAFVPIIAGMGYALWLSLLGGC